MSSDGQCTVLFLSYVPLVYLLVAHLFTHLACVRHVEAVSCNLDIPSRTAIAPLVLVGRIRRMESPPPSFTRSGTSRGSRDDANYFNVTVDVRNVLKGDLPKDSRNVYLPIVVGVFTTEEDRVNCIPSVSFGLRYLMFLNNTGVSSSANRAAAFYRIIAFPVRSTNESLNVARQYSCSTCGK